MKKIIISMIIIFQFYTIGVSQTFNERIRAGNLNLFFNNLHLTNDTIVVFGYNNVLEPFLKVKLNITKFDLEGELIEQDILMLDSFRNYIPWYQGATSINNSGKILLSGSGDEQSINHEAFTLLMSKKYDIDWIHYYEPLDSSITSINTASILLEDNSSYNVIVDRATPFNYQARIAHLDGEGELVWEKFYTDTNYYYSPFSIIMDADSNLIVGLERALIINNTGEYSASSVIWKTDLQGKILDELINEPLTKTPNKLLETENSDYMYIDKILTGVEDDGDPLFKSRINRIDSNLENIWSHEVGKSFYLTELHNLIQTNDGNFIAVGRSPNLDIDPICSCGHVVKFDGEGKIIWESYINIALDTNSENSFTRNVFYDIKELDSGGFIAVGESRGINVDSFPQQGWIVRMDEMGQVTHTFAIPQYDHHAISIYPNPASTFVRFSSDKLALQEVRVQVFSMQGTMVMDTQYSEDKLDVSGLASGLYSVVIDGKYVVQLVKKE